MWVNLRKYIISLIVLIIITGIIVLLKNLIFINVEVYENKAVLNVKYLFPMIQTDIDKYINIEPEYEKCKYSYSYDWINEKELTILIEEKDYPKGQRVNINLKGVPSRYILSMDFERVVQFKCSPNIIDVKPSHIVSTEGPIDIVFNTLIDEDSIKKHLILPFEYKITPLKYSDEKGKKIDYSYWSIYPIESLLPETEYILRIKEGLKSQSNKELQEEIQLTVITDKIPLITDVNLKDGDRDVSIYPKIQCVSNEIIKKGIVKIDGIDGKVTIDDYKLEFLPNKLLDPNKDYTIILQVVNEKGEKSLPKEITFHTMSIPDDKLWVEVALGKKQEVIIYEGNKAVKKMPCSGGKSDTPTVLGTFYLKERGESFFSQRFGEGANHWVRIVDQYLFHSIPQNKDGEIIQSELEKIGKPASHGCIRLLDEDAEWFYYNIPDGTMVIIHE